MSWTGTWMALGWIAIAFGFLRWLYRQDPEGEPEGARILYNGPFDWSYVIEERRHTLRSGRYRTRGAAIRAAKQELKRLGKRIET